MFNFTPNEGKEDREEEVDKVDGGEGGGDHTGG